MHSCNKTTEKQTVLQKFTFVPAVHLLYAVTARFYGREILSVTEPQHRKFSVNKQVTQTNTSAFSLHTINLLL